ncbi:MAG: PAS domain-containing protein, partial [Desulfomonilaceae bacterium]
MKISETTAAIFGFIVGSSLLITFSVLQRIAFNISNFEIQSFAIPFFIGGFLGAALGYLLARFHARTEEVERLVQIKTEETARIERQKEAALAEQHRITQEILNQSRLVDTLLSTLPAPVFFKDPEGKYQGCNRAFEELFGVTADEV